MRGCELFYRCVQGLAKLHESISPRRCRGTEKNKKQTIGRLKSTGADCEYTVVSSAGHCRAALGLTGEDARPSTNIALRPAGGARLVIALHFFGLIVGGEGVDDWLQLAVHYLF